MRHHMILRVIVKLIVAHMILFAFYVQFHGDYSPGGGFQAGVIMAVAFIIYGVVFGLRNAHAVFPPWLVHKLMAIGLLLYALTGVFSMMVGFDFLDYDALWPSYPKHGQHYGIIIIELGVGITVAGVMVGVYYAFAGRPPRISDEEW